MTVAEAQAIAERIAELEAEIEELVGDLNEANYILLGGTVSCRYGTNEDGTCKED